MQQCLYVGILLNHKVVGTVAAAPLFLCHVPELVLLLLCGCSRRNFSENPKLTPLLLFEKEMPKPKTPVSPLLYAKVKNRAAVRIQDVSIPLESGDDSLRCSIWGGGVAFFYILACAQ